MKTVFALLRYVALACAVVAALVFVVVPTVANAHGYTILTGSMTPRYPPGTLVYVRAKPPQDIRVGDVLTYQVASGEPTVVTHRVVSIGVQHDGTKVFTLKGDANNAADPQPVLPVQIRGTLLYAIPWMGYPANWLSHQVRLIGGINVVIWSVAGVFILYGLVRWWQAYAGKRRAQQMRSVNHEG